MDISSMLSGAPSSESRQSPDSSRPPPPPSLPSGGSSTQATTPAAFSSHSHQNTPLYAPPTAGGTRAPQGAAAAPLQTPPHPPAAAQYPFPRQVSQSPAAAQHGQQYRPPDAVASTTPLAKASGHGYSYPPAPFHPPLGVAGGVSSYPPSASPTSSLHHSPTPLSMRQSPFAATSQPSQAQHQYQHSQPTTPLGPPPLVHQRSSTFSDYQSPSHQRRVSAASSGVIMGSPALQNHPSIGNLVDSPGATSRASSQIRRTSDYLSQLDRERSVSVSPKTRVPPRPTSMESRHSSLQDTQSARNSMQASVPPGVGSPNHMLPQQRTPTVQAATRAVSQYPQAANEVPQVTAPASFVPDSMAAIPGADMGSLSSPPNAPPPLISHRPQKMGMSHLLTPASVVPPALQNGSHAGGLQTSEMSSKELEPVGMSVSSNIPPDRPVPSAAPSPNNFQDQRATTESSAPSTWEHEIEEDGQRVPPLKHENSKTTTPPLRMLKREADTELYGPASKQRRTRKYPDRPSWAQYSKHNPRFQQQQSRTNGVSRTVQEPKPPQSRAKPNGAPVQNQSEEAALVGESADDGRPWLQNPPLDADLISARKILGRWEKTFQWNTPYPDLLRAVQDWIYLKLDGLQDVGWNSQEGAIEIEAKIGTLLDRDDQRCKLPVTTSTVIDPAANKNFHFESQMTELEHKAMNEFLNVAIRETLQKGRVPMSYKHLYEVDSFRELSPVGLRAIPQSIQQRQTRHDTKLRTTTEFDKNGNAKGIKARIVKVNIDNLHIFNPMHRYDCRISINLEVNLDQPALDPADLIVEPTETRPAQPNRNKDRVSYQHLAYSIDLTKVHIAGLPPKHELELEVDANLLRQHHQLLKTGQPNGFGDIVSGFLDNATFLMRQRAPA